MLHFSEGVHEEVKKHGVTVTCLCPGYVMTEFQQVAGLDKRRLPRPGRLTPRQVVAAALKGAAAGRAIVVPGVMNRTLATGLVRLTPRFAVRRIAGSLFKDAGVGLGTNVVEGLQASTAGPLSPTPPPNKTPPGRRPRPPALLPI